MMAPSGSVLYLHCFRGICCFHLLDGRVVYPGDRGSRYAWKVGNTVHFHTVLSH